MSEDRGTTAYFTFSTQMRPSLHQFSIFGNKNGLTIDEDKQTLIKLSGESLKSYAEHFVQPLLYAGQYVGNSARNVRQFLRREFHMDDGQVPPLPHVLRLDTSRKARPNPIPRDHSHHAHYGRGLRAGPRHPRRSVRSSEPAGPWPMTVGSEDGSGAHPLALLSAGSLPIRLIVRRGDRDECARGTSMLILTADDHGRTSRATDSVLRCGADRRISCASAMVFMADSERAATLAGDSAIEFGLHLNFTEPLSGSSVPGSVRLHHGRVQRFLTSHRLAPACSVPDSGSRSGSSTSHSVRNMNGFIGCRHLFTTGTTTCTSAPTCCSRNCYRDHREFGLPFRLMPVRRTCSTEPTGRLFVDGSPLATCPQIPSSRSHRSGISTDFGCSSRGLASRRSRLRRTRRIRPSWAFS